MNLSILKENLKQGLFVVSHLAGKNTNLPILNNILVEAKKEGVRLVTTNLEVESPILFGARWRKKAASRWIPKFFPII